MRVTAEERRRTEQRIRAAATALLRGDLPPGGSPDITTLARQAGISRATLYRSYPHLKTEFEQQVAARPDDQQSEDPRDARITRLKTENEHLAARIADKDATIGELEQFKTLAISRLAAQHEEIHRLRAATVSAPVATVRALQPRRTGPDNQ
jgi:AcrR family transcriptional regulator